MADMPDLFGPSPGTPATPATPSTGTAAGTKKTPASGEKEKKRTYMCMGCNVLAALKYFKLNYNLPQSLNF